MEHSAIMEKFIALIFAIVSQPLEICERVSEYGCIEKCFSKPNWSVNYADVIQMREPQQLGLVAEVEVKYNE